MKALLLLLLIVLTGCTTVPVIKQEFPPISKSMEQQCPELVQADKSELLSDLLRSVIINYGHYHTCKAVVEAWQQWYVDQKKSYEEKN